MKKMYVLFAALLTLTGTLFAADPMTAYREAAAAFAAEPSVKTMQSATGAARKAMKATGATEEMDAFFAAQLSNEERLIASAANQYFFSKYWHVKDAIQAKPYAVAGGLAYELWSVCNYGLSSGKMQPALIAADCYSFMLGNLKWVGGRDMERLIDLWYEAAKAAKMSNTDMATAADALYEAFGFRALNKPEYAKLRDKAETIGKLLRK